MVPRRRFSRRFAATAAAIALFFLYHIFSLQSDLRPRRQSSSWRTSKSNAEPQTAGEPAPYCPPLPGIEDVLVVMKTGVTEAREKVPIHF